MNCAARLWRRKSASSSAAWGRTARLFNCWLCVASIGIRSHSSSAASQLWCGSTCGHPSTTGFREKPTAADCPDSISLVTATVVEAGEGFLLDGRVYGSWPPLRRSLPAIRKVLNHRGLGTCPEDWGREVLDLYRK